MQQREPEIHAFLSKTFLFTEDPSALDRQASLLEQGIMDSTGVLELVCFLEERFGIQVLDEELLPENLDSVVKITDFVKRKSADSRAA
jgi:acyl carrier protein